MFIDIGFLVCSSTTTKTYLQCTKHTFIGVCWILCAWSLIKNLTGWCRKVFHCSFLCLVIFYFRIHVLLFPSSGSCWLASRILSIMQSSSPSLCEEIKWNSGTKKEKDFVLKNHWLLKNQFNICQKPASCSWWKAKTRIKIYAHQTGFTCLHHYKLTTYILPIGK